MKERRRRSLGDGPRWHDGMKRSDTEARGRAGGSPRPGEAGSQRAPGVAVPLRGG